MAYVLKYSDCLHNILSVYIVDCFYVFSRCLLKSMVCVVLHFLLFFYNLLTFFIEPLIVIRGILVKFAFLQKAHYIFCIFLMN